MLLDSTDESVGLSSWFWWWGRFCIFVPPKGLGPAPRSVDSECHSNTSSNSFCSRTDDFCLNYCWCSFTPIWMNNSIANYFHQHLGCLDGSESVTRLGYAIGGLPLPPATAKLLLTGTLLGCGSAVVASAAAVGYRWEWIPLVFHIIYIALLFSQWPILAANGRESARGVLPDKTPID